MAAVCPAGPEPMMMTLRASIWVTLSVLEGRRLQRRAPVLRVDTEPNSLARVTLHERVPILLQRVRKLLERQAIRWLPALLLHAHEVLVHQSPFGRVVCR